MTQTISEEEREALRQEGYERAIAEGLHEPEGAVAWLDARLREERAMALRKHAATLHDPEMRAMVTEFALIEERSGPVDRLAVSLQPFRDVLEECERRKRAFGGGVQSAYHNAAELIRSAFAQYEER